MQTISINEGQNLLDVVCLYAGDASLALMVAMQNNISITDDLTIGQSVTMPAYSKPVRPVTLTTVTNNNAPAIVSEGQALIDIAMQCQGDASRLVELALLNNIGITEDLEIGQAVTYGDALVNKRFITDLYKKQGLLPASIDNAEADLQGIGYWAIGLAFIVS